MEAKLNFRRLNRILSMLLEVIERINSQDAEVSKQWHYMHIFSCSQLIKPAAQKKGLSMELAAIIAALHDYGLLVTGEKERHAEKGADLADVFLDQYNRDFGEERGVITAEERTIIKNAIFHHSEKDIDSGEPYLELLKDIDCLDRYLHGVLTEGVYMERASKIFSY